MSGPSHSPSASKASGRPWTIPLSYAVTAPFVLLLLLAVGLTGYLSFQSGRQSVNDMALRLQDEILARIDREVRVYLNTPRLINQANKNAVELGMHDPFDLSAWKDHLLRQAAAYTYAGNIAAGNEQRQYIGIDLHDDGQTVIQVSDASTGFDLRTHAVDDSGRLGELIHVSEDYDPTIRPWYRDPAEARRPGWSDIYKHFVDPTLQIALSDPIFDAAGNLVGVTTAALRLSRIAEFLEILDVGENGRMFILEPSGLLVASSGLSPFRLRPDGTIDRINILDNDDILPQAALDELKRLPDGLTAVTGPIVVRYPTQKFDHFLKIVPLRDEFGLNWLVAVDLSEDDFLGQINKNFRNTLLLIALTLLVSVYLGVLVNRRAVRPLLELDRVAQQIAGGDLASRVDETRIDEIGRLARSFNVMADRVKESVHALEQRVEELHLAQETIRKSEAKFRILFEKSSLTIIIHDKDTGEILDANPTALGQFGFASLKEMLAYDFWLDSPYSLSDALALIRKAATEGPQRFEWLSRKKNGELFWQDAHMHAVVIDERECVLATTMDITDRKQAEQEQERLQAQLNQAQKMESVGILAGGVAHDFNNLLQAMGGNIELLLAGKADEHPDVGRLRAMLKSIERAAQLVRQLLLFSRKEGSCRVPVDLNREVEEAARMLERTIPKMIALELHLDPQARPLFADPVQLEQILFNLVNNSMDAMPEGGKLIIETSNVSLDAGFVRLNPGSTAGPHVLLSVTDTGRGMGKEVLEHVFDPFFTTKEVGKGTGLGLASVYGIIKAHGGHIQCASEPGKGTKFRIYLPAGEQGDVPEMETLPEPSPLGGHETILVVDDEPEIRELTLEALVLLGYAVKNAATGEEALTIYQEQGHDIDLVLLDLNMPGMGGQRCLQELLLFDPKVKVVIASGYTAHGHGQNALSSGAMGFISKPYQLKELAAVVRSVLDEKRAEPCPDAPE